METPNNGNQSSNRLLSMNVIVAAVVSQVVNVVFEHISPWPAPCCRQQWLLTTVPANVGLACILEEITASILAVETYADSAAVATGLSVTSFLLTVMKAHMWINTRHLLYRGLYVFTLSWVMMATMVWLESSPSIKQSFENVQRQLQSTITDSYASLRGPQAGYRARSPILTTQEHRAGYRHRTSVDATNTSADVSP